MTDKMTEEKIRIDSLLNAGKISKDDHKILMGAVTGEQPTWQKVLRLSFNPFVLMESSVALAIAALVAVLMCFMAISARIYFPGALDVQVARNFSKDANFIKLIVQNIISVGAISLTFYLGSLLLKKRNLRVVDFLG